MVYVVMADVCSILGGTCPIMDLCPSVKTNKINYKNHICVCIYICINVCILICVIREYIMGAINKYVFIYVFLLFITYK